jgi:hypothetical protein
VRQALYHLSHVLVIFQIGSHIFAWAIPTHSWNYMYKTTPSLLVKMGVSLTFYQDWTPTVTLSISASQVAGITSVHHHT